MCSKRIRLIFKCLSAVTWLRISKRTRSVLTSFISTLSITIPTGTGCAGGAAWRASKGMAAAMTIVRVQKSFIVGVLTSIKREDQAKLRRIFDLEEIDFTGFFLRRFTKFSRYS